MTRAAGIFLFHPTISNYPKARFPGVVIFSEIYQGLLLSSYIEEIADGNLAFLALRLQTMPGSCPSPSYRLEIHFSKTIFIGRFHQSNS